MSNGIVVKHKATGNTYAVSEENYNPETETKVRPLKIHESVMSFPVRTSKVAKAGATELPNTKEENK